MEAAVSNTKAQCCGIQAGRSPGATNLESRTISVQDPRQLRGHVYDELTSLAVAQNPAQMCEKEFVLLIHCKTHQLRAAFSMGRTH
jgi:hypothetical protein